MRELSFKDLLNLLEAKDKGFLVYLRCDDKTKKVKIDLIKEVKSE